MKQIVIFTDLDATLLHHETYSFDACRPALLQIEARDIPLVLSTSKTLDEVGALRSELCNEHPFIVENGGVVCVPNGYFRQHRPKPDSLNVHHFGMEYDRVVASTSELRRLYGFRFHGFSDWSIEKIADQTGLSLEQARLAKRRLCTEPILWSGNEAELALFQAKLHDHGLTLTKGGRFLHVGSNVDKGVGVNWLLDQYRRKYEDILSVGLGDSPNDIGMLRSVDIPVVVRSRNGTAPDLERVEGAIHTDLAGPAGWNETVLGLLEKYG